MTALMTRLPSIVENDFLDEIGSFRIKINSVENPNSNTQKLQIWSNTKDLKLKLTNGGFFTDSSLSENLGSEYVVKKDGTTSSTFHVSNTDCELIVPNKYELSILSTLTNESVKKGMSVNLDDIGFTDNMRTLQLSGMASVEGSFSSLGKNGCKAYEYFLTGLSNGIDVEDIVRAYKKSGGTSNLVTVSVNYSNVFGDIGKAFAETRLNALYALSAKGNLHGDLSKAKIRIVYGDGTDWSNCTWNGRPNGMEAIIFKATNIGDKIDAYLNDLVNCTDISEKSISVKGTRTSSSDNAVSALKLRGYSISVNGEKL